jgi:hypothetical protein
MPVAEVALSIGTVRRRSSIGRAALSEGGQVPIAYDAGGYYLLGYVNFQLG